MSSWRTHTDTSAPSMFIYFIFDHSPTWHSHLRGLSCVLYLLDELVMSVAAVPAELRRLSLSGLLSALLRAEPLTALSGMPPLMLPPPAAYERVSPTFLRRPGDVLTSEGISKWLLCVVPGCKIACTGCAVEPPSPRSACCRAFLVWEALPLVGCPLWAVGCPAGALGSLLAPPLCGLAQQHSSSDYATLLHGCNSASSAEVPSGLVHLRRGESS